MSPSESPSETLPYDGEFVLPKLTCTGTSSTVTLSGDFEIPAITMEGTIDAESHCSGDFVLTKLTSTGESLAHSSGTFELYEITFGNRVPNESIGEFDLPLFRFTGRGRLLPITELHKVIVMNLQKQAISTYSNFDFNSIVNFNGRYLVSTDTGIYPLGGNLDNGVRINARVKSGSMDFGEKVIKYARDIWITHRTDGHLALLIRVDEAGSTEIEKHTSIVSDEIREERLKPPRGLRGRFYTVELKNLSGSDFDIDSISMLVESVKRKIR